MIKLTWTQQSQNITEAQYEDYLLWAYPNGHWTLIKGLYIVDGSVDVGAGDIALAKREVEKAFHRHLGCHSEPVQEQDEPRIIIGLTLTPAQAARWDALVEVAAKLDEDGCWIDRVAYARDYCMKECAKILDDIKEKENAL